MSPLSKEKGERGLPPPFLYVSIIYCVSLVVSNISAFKLVSVGNFMFPAAVLLFPVTYIANDILAEIYGFARTRKIIWLGFFINFFTVAFFALTIILPSPVFFEGASAYAAVLGSTPWVLGASLCAYLAGSFLNASTVSRLKASAENKGVIGASMAFRLILSTIIGEGADSVIFITLAFIGTMPGASLIAMIFTQASIKILYEVALYPVTRVVILRLREKEGGE